MSDDLYERLNDTGHSDLLPTGTTAFPSTARAPRIFWAVVAFVCVLFPVLLGAGTFSSGSAGTALVVLSLLILVGGVGGAYWLKRNHVAAHDRTVRQGACLEGVFVFPDGQLCVRYQHLFTETNAMIKPALLGKADVEIKFSWSRCGRISFLRLHYMDDTGRQQIIRLPSTGLSTDVISIAAAVNDAKLAALKLEFEPPVGVGGRPLL